MTNYSETDTVSIMNTFVLEPISSGMFIQCDEIYLSTDRTQT